MRYLFIFIGNIVLFASCDKPAYQYASLTVKQVDLDRYQGVWYEIYRLPMRAERDLVNVTATYTIQDDGMVGVLNQGYKHTPQGAHKKANAKAWRPDQSVEGVLIVKFFNLFSSPYLIRALDADYQWAIVTSPENKYAWILARKPQLEKEVDVMLLDSANAIGIDTGKFIKTMQKWK